MSTRLPERLESDSAGLRRAADLLREGALVAFPTETVYGLGADALDGHAVALIFEAKGRPRFNPLIVHVYSIEQAETIAVFDERARRLAARFWPGPLTLVLPIAARASLSPLVTAGLDSVAVRMPRHPVALALLAEVGTPIAAPSANPSGRLSPTTAEHVVEGLASRVAAVVDGGSAEVGLESTIVGLVDGPVLLRPGGITVEEIELCLGEPLGRPEAKMLPTAPGQLASHYAPRADLRLEATGVREGEVWLGFGDTAADLDLSPTRDLKEAAANLFGFLRALDERGAERIAVSPIPMYGLGLAINDRLKRAAAPRTESANEGLGSASRRGE
jgi:L-threonylcarbamoyladenylate synthase